MELALCLPIVTVVNVPVGGEETFSLYLSEIFHQQFGLAVLSLNIKIPKS